MYYQVLKREHYSQHRCLVLISSCSLIFLCLLFLLIFATTLFAEKDSGAVDGLAWLVQGTWRVNGKGAPISTGDAIQPGLVSATRRTRSQSFDHRLSGGRSKDFLRMFHSRRLCARISRAVSYYASLTRLLWVCWPAFHADAGPGK